MWLLTGSAMKSMVGRMTDPAITSRSSRARDLHHMKQKPKLRNLSETLPETPAMHSSRIRTPNEGREKVYGFLDPTDLELDGQIRTFEGI